MYSIQITQLCTLTLLAKTFSRLAYIYHRDNRLCQAGFIRFSQLEPPIIKGGQDLPKFQSLGGLPNFLLERGNKPEKGGLIQRWRVATFFITLQFNQIYSLCGKSKASFITFQFFNLLSQPCKILIKSLQYQNIVSFVYF